MQNILAAAAEFEGDLICERSATSTASRRSSPLDSYTAVGFRGFDPNLLEWPEVKKLEVLESTEHVDTNQRGLGLSLIAACLGAAPIRGSRCSDVAWAVCLLSP